MQQMGVVPYPPDEQMDMEFGGGLGTGVMDGISNAFLPRAHSMELHNDPRFFSSNVVEKRLAAFSGLSVIASLTTGTALNQCFAMKKDFNFGELAGWIQIVGFFSMASIVFMSLTATIVFVYQAFFTHRLATAGPTGFELAKEFYLHPDVVKWRHAALRCLGYGLPLLLFSTGCMLYVKFAAELDIFFYIYGVQVSPWGLVTLVIFTVGSVVLFYIAAKHESVFNFEYQKKVPHDGLLAMSSQQPRGVRPGGRGMC